MINARAESVLEKPAFARGRDLAALPGAGRGLVRVAGQSPTATDAKGKPRKQPFFIHRADGATVAFAGLYEFWRDRQRRRTTTTRGAWLTTFTIITTAAEPGLDRIHDRQPLVLERERVGRLARPRP